MTRQVLDGDQLNPPASARRQRGDSGLDRLEQFEQTGVAGAVYRTRSDHTPGPGIRGRDRPLAGEFRFPYQDTGRGGSDSVTVQVARAGGSSAGPAAAVTKRVQTSPRTAGGRRTCHRGRTVGIHR